MRLRLIIISKKKIFINTKLNLVSLSFSEWIIQSARSQYSVTRSWECNEIFSYLKSLVVSGEARTLELSRDCLYITCSGLLYSVVPPVCTRLTDTTHQFTSQIILKLSYSSRDKLCSNDVNQVRDWAIFRLEGFINSRMWLIYLRTIRVTE